MQTGTLFSKMVDAAIAADHRMKTDPLILQLIQMNREIHEEYGWFYHDTAAESQEPAAWIMDQEYEPDAIIYVERNQLIHGKQVIENFEKRYEEQQKKRNVMRGQDAQ